MKQIFKYSMMLVVMMMAVFGFTACSSSDDEDLPGGYVKTTEGVHRVEVSFDGNTAGWNGDLTFIAVYGDGTHGKVKLYENGSQISDSGAFSSEELRNYDIQTDAVCDQMALTIIMSHSAGKTVEPVTVTLKSYINGVQKKVKTATFNANEVYKTIVFDSELEADIL